MRTWMMAVVAAAMLASSAPAQYREPYGQRRGPEFDVTGRVLRNIDSVRGGPWWGRGELNQLDKARNDLYRFQDNFSRGRFDRGRLDSAIGHLDNVARGRRVPPRERDMIQRDVMELREFRARAGNGPWRR